MYKLFGCALLGAVSTVVAENYLVGLIMGGLLLAIGIFDIDGNDKSCPFPLEETKGRAGVSIEDFFRLRK